MRKITVDGMNFEWKVGKSNVLVRDPNGVSYYTDLWKISETIEHEDPLMGSVEVVLPKGVSEYIKHTVIPLMNKGK